jgi:site-specific recombinase XerD
MSTEPLLRFAQHLRASDRSKNTVEAYLRDLRLFSEWFESSNGEDMVPQTITPIDVKEYKAYLLQVKRFKPATVNRRLASISAFCEWAKEQSLIEANPTEGIRNVKAVEMVPRWLTRKEQYALLRAVQKEGNRRDEAVIMLLLNTGLRVSEASGLRLSDIEISQRKGQVTVRDGKGGKHRVVPLNADVRKALAEYLDARPEARHDYLLVGKQRGQLKPWGIQYVTSKYAYLAKLDSVTPHTLRHTFGKNLVDAGVSLDKVATLLGHKNLNTTRIYTRPSGTDLAQAVARLEIR